MSVADVIDGRARWTTLVGDVRETLRTLPEASVQCVVTSPPYWGLRDYGVAGQIGQEPTPAEYVATLRDLFRELRRVLREDGTAWLNLGDSYAGSWGAQSRESGNVSPLSAGQVQAAQKRTRTGSIPQGSGLKPKDLVGIPWRVAFALQDDGWWLRSDIVWAKPNPMPESVRDRPTRAHEYVFLLTKSARYFYDADAVREPMIAGANGSRFDTGKTLASASQMRPVGSGDRTDNPLGRNARDVWTITPEPYDGAHFATMPPELARRCVRAGSRRGDMVLDPFGGSGTTARVALEEGRRAILCELNPEYVELQRERCERPIQADLFGGGRTP